MRFFLLFIVMMIQMGCAPQDAWHAYQVQSRQSDVPVAEQNAGITLEQLPVQLNLDVPFYAQAPRGDWGMPYQEACEEASLLLAWYAVTGQRPTLEEFEADLLAMIEWEVTYFGAYEHTTIEQTAEMARVYLGYDAVEVVENPTVEQLQGFLFEGAPVVVPFAGRYLKNPYFTGLGPVYHMLVLKGYEPGKFITNDVGTRHGADFTYVHDTFMNALHDWDEAAAVDPEGILRGAKKVLVVRPL